MTFWQKVHDIEGFSYDSGQAASRLIPFSAVFHGDSR